MIGEEKEDESKQLNKPKQLSIDGEFVFAPATDTDSADETSAPPTGDAPNVGDLFTMTVDGSKVMVTKRSCTTDAEGVPTLTTDARQTSFGELGQASNKTAAPISWLEAGAFAEDEKSELAILGGGDTIKVGEKTFFAADGTQGKALVRLSRHRVFLDSCNDALRDRLVYVQTFSKTYAMTGWRIGYVATQATYINAIARVHRTINGSLNTSVQEAALEALATPAAELADRLATYEERSQMVVAALSGVAGLTVIKPEGAFYAFIKYDSEQPSHEVVRDLAERGVLVRAGSEYGPSGEGHFRISFATSKGNLERGLQTIADYFSTRA